MKAFIISGKNGVKEIKLANLTDDEVKTIRKLLLTGLFGLLKNGALLTIGAFIIDMLLKAHQNGTYWNLAGRMIEYWVVYVVLVTLVFTILTWVGFRRSK